jgi:hypothetical protein
MDPRDEELRECRVEIERLREENAALRWSSESFVGLAQRLNERLLQRDRRRLARPPAAIGSHDSNPKDKPDGEHADSL